jgi:hypothetical protein
LASYPEYAEQLRLYLQKSLELKQSMDDSSSERIPFDWALDESIKAVGDGASPESCYQRYPYYAEKLRPWLNSVVDLRRSRLRGELQIMTVPAEDVVPDVPFTQALEEYLQAVKDNNQPGAVLRRYPYYARKMQFWAEYVSSYVPAVEPPTPSQLNPVIEASHQTIFGRMVPQLSLQMAVAVAMAFFVFLFSGWSLARASTGSLPGDSLYPLKLTIENLQLQVATGEQEAELRNHFAEVRRQEALALIEAGRQSDVVIEGQVTFVNDEMALVNDVAVVFADLGENSPPLNKGEYVKVEGTTDSSGVKAKHYEVQPPPLAFVPPATATPHPLPTTRPPATSTAVIRPSATPTAVVIISAATATTKPADVPADTSTPVPTDTRVPTNTSTPIPTNTSTPVPTSTSTPAPTDTLVPTDTPAPTDTRVPTDTPAPTDTRVPTDTPVPPTDTPVPPPTNTPVPQPTDTPLPPTSVPPTQPPAPSDTATPEGNISVNP